MRPYAKKYILIVFYGYFHRLETFNMKFITKIQFYIKILMKKLEYIFWNRASYYKLHCII